MASNNPFLIIKRCHSMDPEENIDAVRVYKSYILKENISPRWTIQEIKVQTFCNSNEDLPVIFEIWSFNNSGTHSKYGSFQTSLSGILGLTK